MRVGIVAGEASGDLLGAGLIKALAEQSPGIVVEGVAGPLMQAAGCSVWEDADALAVMGLIEPLKELPRLLALRRDLVRRWRASPPDVFVGIDSPEFNLSLARRLRESGIRTVQYVSPQVWAWRQRRVRKIGRAVDAVLCLLPFEKAFYDEHDVTAVTVGHPLADRLPADPDAREARGRLGMHGNPVVAILPGSRSSEVARLAPIFIAAARLLTERFDNIGFVAPMANAAARDIFASHLASGDLAARMTLTDGDATTAIAAADAVLLASGTASLQTALLQRPMVSAYKVAPLTYVLARLFRLLKVAHFTMPNLLTPEPLVPEFLQGEATPAVLAGEVAKLLEDPQRREEIRSAFAALRSELALGADQRAAAAVISVAESGSGT